MSHIVAIYKVRHGENKGNVQAVLIIEHTKK